MSDLEGLRRPCSYTYVQVCNVAVITRLVTLVQVELEVESLSRRLRLVEDELEQSQERLQTSQEQLHDATKLADETDRYQP